MATELTVLITVAFGAYMLYRNELVLARLPSYYRMLWQLFTFRWDV